MINKIIHLFTSVLINPFILKNRAICTNPIITYCNINTIKIILPSITIKYSSDMKPPINGNLKLTIKITLQIQLLNDGDNIREPLSIYLQYTAININGEITTWLAPTIIPIHLIISPHKLICNTLL